MPFMVWRFKEINLQKCIWNCVKMAEIDALAFLKELFQNTPFKDIKILRWNEGREQSGVVACKIKREMCVATSN